ncbi:hypothetical protein J8J20_26015, partial [Mycobacterium tuberculosis]|nr:hypothetical protein [Mycobacterium tuberculosis]
PEFYNDPATAEIYPLLVVGSVRCVAGAAGAACAASAAGAGAAAADASCAALSPIHISAPTRHD